MKAGNFNIYSYLDKLNEEAEMAEKATPKATPKVDTLGMIIPDTNTKTYNWLKSEYQKGKTEVKVEMNIGGAKFEPGYDMQGNVKTTDSFKPGMFGAVKTDDTPPAKKDVTTGTEAKKPEEGKAPAAETPEKAEKSETAKAPAPTKPTTAAPKKPEENKEEKKSEVKGKSLNFDLKTKKNDKA
jgi:hypothetical protein